MTVNAGHRLPSQCHFYYKQLLQRDKKKMNTQHILQRVLHISSEKQSHFKEGNVEHILNDDHDTCNDNRIAVC